MELPKRNCLMRPSDYMSLPNVEKVFEGDIGELIKIKQKAMAVVPVNT